MADRFFTDKPLSVGEFVLDGDEAHHLGTVRRFEPGERVVLFDGGGAEYPAEIVSVGRKQVILRVVTRLEVSREVPFPVIVASALPKAHRLDFLLEKLIEVGATRFVPLVTARSVVTPRIGKVEKWRRGAIEASKQCGRNVLMRIDEPMSLTDYLASDLPSRRFILHTEGRGPRPEPLPEGVAFAVGPEGGFTEVEIAAALAAGWRELSFGPRTLRIETAAVAAALWAAGGQ